MHKNEKRYSEDAIAKVIEMKKSHVPNKLIAAATGVSINKIKTITKMHGLFLTPAQRQQNAHTAKAAKRAAGLAKPIAPRSAEARLRQSNSIKHTYATTNLKTVIGQRSRESWVKRRSRPDFGAHLKARGAKSRLAKLGAISEEELTQRATALKEAVERLEGTPCTLAEKYGFSVSTACREFHKRGWSDLVSKGASQGQLEVFQYVQSLCAGEYIHSNSRSIITPLELDIFVPSARLAIEYNGLYWHSDASESFKRGAHARKARLCAEKDVDLLAIYEDEWANPVKQELIKAMIRWRLRKFNGTKLRASKLSLVRLDKNAQFKNFFNANHIDGHAQASYALALVDSDQQIISALSVRTNHNGEQEIARMATDYRFMVHGAAQRLISHLPRPVISYSNNRLSRGNVYKKLGFVEITQTTDPSYWYTDFQERIWRFRCRRDNSPEILSVYPTETDQARAGVFSHKIFGDNRALYRIEDYGHRKWLLK